MIIRSISGTAIDETMTNSMFSTLNALANEGIITREQATAFGNTHVCLMVNSDNVWYKIKKFLNWSSNDENAFWPVIFKLPEAPRALTTPEEEISLENPN